MSERELPQIENYSRAAIWANAIVALIVTFLLAWWAAGQAVFYETLFRVGPTVEGGGVGTDWVVGNTKPALDALIAITHAVDVLMGLFILLMVFIHWGAFRRIASRMRQPGEEGEAVAADGGRVDENGGESP